MEWIENTKNFLLLDGRVLAERIRNKPENMRRLWEKIYLWFHDNFEKIIIIGGLIILGMLIYNYLDAGNCVQANKNQHGGDTNIDSSDNSIPSPENSQKTKDELRAKAILKATETAEQQAKKDEKKTITENNQGKPTGFIKKKAEENKSKIKTFVKSIPSKTIGAASGKASAAWKSVKSGEALELGKEKFADAFANSKDFIQRYARTGYVLAFTTFMVVGFGLFFVPTLIMFIIGAITLAIFNKQKKAFLANT